MQEQIHFFEPFRLTLWFELWKMIFVIYHCDNGFVKFMTYGLHNYNIFTEEMFFVKHVDIGKKQNDILPKKSCIVYNIKNFWKQKSESNTAEVGRKIQGSRIDSICLILWLYRLLPSVT
jgi:hypothetical protein